MWFLLEPTDWYPFERGLQAACEDGQGRQGCHRSHPGGQTSGLERAFLVSGPGRLASVARPWALECRALAGNSLASL
eukprot:4421523-Pyramimonas_sp.AAC.1